MNKGIYPALSGGVAYEKMLSVISNNLANINTSGFKADKTVFKVDMPDEVNVTLPVTQDTASAENLLPPADNTLIEGPSDKYFTAIDSLYTDFNPGVVKQTGNPLDLSIDGNGFFVVNTPDGVRYTRSGNFTVNSSNTLTTASGHIVMGENGPIILEDGKISINAEGTISVNGSEVNKIKVVDFVNPGSLMKDGGNLFKGADEKAPESYKVVQGTIELSNVNPVEEMASMIEVLRGYETYQKVMTTMDETSAKANEIGRV
ncbi:MAG: flagellar basal-body rod protein FlgF [Nitrospirae bacterium]|nr:flagellar basal-body rod protein FlgF [Nitrospirota bacterium]